MLQSFKPPCSFSAKKIKFLINGGKIQIHSTNLAALDVDAAYLWYTVLIFMLRLHILRVVCKANGVTPL